MIMLVYKRLSFVVGWLVLSVSLSNASSHPEASADRWTGWGGSYLNNRWSSSTKVTSSTIHTIKQHCRVSYPVGVSAPPAIHDGIAYYATWNGSVVALQYKTCSVKWQINVTALIEKFSPPTVLQTILVPPVSRTSPQIDEKNNVVYFGTQTSALVVAADLRSGKVLGVHQINTHPLATITTSPTFYNQSLFVGVSSAEENAAFFTNTNESQYPCCSFIGNMVSLSFSRTTSTFTTHWDIPMIQPDAPTNNTPGTWSGIGVWGSQPAIDVKRNQVIISTGNVYTAPQAFLSCVPPDDDAPSTTSNSTTSGPCPVPPSIWQEATLALDIPTGRPNWIRHLSPVDAWTVVCGIPGAIPRDPLLCPHEPGPDADFGMAPAFIPAHTQKQKHNKHGHPAKDIVSVGQKNGNLYALDAATGEIEWATITSPGGPGGGLMWGVAADEERVYFTAVNFAQEPWPLLGPGNVSSVYSGPGFGAVRQTDGSVVWSIAAPEGQITQVPATVVGDLVLMGWTGPTPSGIPPVSTGPGGLLGLERETGREVFRLPVDGPLYGGVAVQGGRVFLGTGYKGGAGVGSFYVFEVGRGK